MTLYPQQALIFWALIQHNPTLISKHSTTHEIWALRLLDNVGDVGILYFVSFNIFCFKRIVSIASLSSHSLDQSRANQTLLETQWIVSFFLNNLNSLIWG